MNFHLPTLSNAADAALAMATIVAGVAEGSLTASEASELSNLVDGYVRALEASELERRVKQIEAHLQTEAL